MGFYAEAWLREARDRIDAESKQFPGTVRSKDTEFETISAAVEKAITAALIERHGSIPQNHEHDKLVSLCETSGVWDILPTRVSTFGPRSGVLPHSQSSWDGPV